MVVMFVLGRWFTSGLNATGTYLLRCTYVKGLFFRRIKIHVWSLNIQGLNLCRFYAVTQYIGVIVLREVKVVS